MLKSYQAGIAGMRWLVSPRNDVDPVLQYALRPIHGGALDWFDVPTEVAPDRERAASLVVAATEAMPERPPRPSDMSDKGKLELLDRLAAKRGFKNATAAILAERAVSPVASEDTKRLDWLEGNACTNIFKIGTRWYTRAGYNEPHHRAGNLREAVDRASAGEAQS